MCEVEFEKINRSSAASSVSYGFDFEPLVHASMMSEPLFQKSA
jgi:hypothetical protein